MADDPVSESQEPAPEEAAVGGTGQRAAAGPGKPKQKRQRSEAQKAQFAAAAAKRWADQKADQARKAGVNTTGSAGPDAKPKRAGAPKVTTTAYTKAPDSPEQTKRRAEGKPKPDTSDIEPPEQKAPEEQATPKPSGTRGGLLGLLADGLGL